jgi:hypothetical protein
VKYPTYIGSPGDLSPGVVTFTGTTRSLNAGIQKKMGAKGTLQLAADDLLNTNYWRIRTTLPQNNLDTFFNYNFHNRFIRLTYIRKLGNTGLRTVKMKQASEEERRRVN